MGLFGFYFCITGHGWRKKHKQKPGGRHRSSERKNTAHFPDLLLLAASLTAQLPAEMGHTYSELDPTSHLAIKKMP